MSFITSCPSCGTKFRVVADQLRISDGWVRCGRCQEVFDAQAALEAQALAATPETPAMSASAAPSDAVLAAQSPAASVELDFTQLNSTQLHALNADAKEDAQTAAAPSPAAAAVAAAVTAAPSAASGVVQSEGYELPAPAALDAEFELELPEAPIAQGSAWLDVAPLTDAAPSVAASGMASPSQNEPALSAAVSPSSALEPDFDLWETTHVLQAEEAQAQIWAEAVNGRERQALELSAEDALQAPAQAAAAHTEPELIPGFVKQAQRKAWWNQPGVRFAMGMLLMFLPIALLVQVVVHERNLIVAWKPQLRAPMQAMCAALRCEIAPHKNIAAVVLTGSAFVQDAQPNHYKLDLSIQNQDAITVATPALELTLTDAQDQVLVRKVFNPAEMGAPAEMAARSEWTGTLPLVTKGLDLPVAGYRVMAFYP